MTTSTKTQRLPAMPTTPAEQKRFYGENSFLLVMEEILPCPAEAGDMLTCSYLTIHGSGVNTSQEARTTCLLRRAGRVGDHLDSGHARGSDRGESSSPGRYRPIRAP